MRIKYQLTTATSTATMAVGGGVNPHTSLLYLKTDEEWAVNVSSIIVVLCKVTLNAQS